MNISKRTIKAIVFNLLLPGTGYLYIKAITRYPLAIFLLFGAVSWIIGTLTRFVNGDLHHMHQINLSPFFPGLDISLLGIILATAVGIDTYFLAQKTQNSGSEGGKHHKAKA